MLPADSRPLCADPALLPLVDAAFGRGKAGNRAARGLAAVCRRCPVAAACLREGVNLREEGVWGAARRAKGHDPASRFRAVS